MDRRHYKRSHDFHCDARVSGDCGSWAKVRCNARVIGDYDSWAKVRIRDLSAGGLSFVSKVKYEVGQTLCFDLMINGYFSVFEVMISGSVKNVRADGREFTHGVMFDKMEENLRIHIDENAKGFMPNVLWE